MAEATGSRREEPLGRRAQGGGRLCDQGTSLLHQLAMLPGPDRATAGQLHPLTAPRDPSRVRASARRGAKNDGGLADRLNPPLPLPRPARWI